MKTFSLIFLLTLSVVSEAQTILNKRKKPVNKTTVSGPVQTANQTSNVSKLNTQSSPYIKIKAKLPFNNTAKDYYVRKVGNDFILNGDIVIGTDIPQLMSIAKNDGEARWPDASIPIALDASVFTNGNMFDSVMAAIAEFNNKTKLCLVQRNTEHDYVKIVTEAMDAGGNSRVGRIGGEQLVRLSTNADVPTIIHELMHAAGFYHEQGRSDRDNYISIEWSNVKEGMEHNFDLEEDGAPIGNYDFGSIMHYSALSFPKNGNLPTIKCKTGDACTNMLGTGRTFSADDIKAIDLFYSNVSRFPCHTRFPGVVKSTVRFPTVNISESDKAQQSFRHRAEYASKNGFAAGFPNFHEARKGNDIVGGTVLIKHGMVYWLDVGHHLLDYTPLNDFAARMRATQKFAVKYGYIGGFPNYFHADYGGGVVCGTFLLTNKSAEWRDVPLSELGNPPLNDIGARMRSANDYAFRNGYLGGFPTFYHTDYGKGIVCGIILIKKEAGEWRDVVIAEGPR